MAIDPTLLPSLRTQAALDGKPLPNTAFIYQKDDGSIWLDHGILGTRPKMIQPPVAPAAPPTSTA